MNAQFLGLVAVLALLASCLSGVGAIFRLTPQATGQTQSGTPSPNHSSFPSGAQPPASNSQASSSAASPLPISDSQASASAVAPPRMSETSAQMSSAAEQAERNLEKRKDSLRVFTEIGPDKSNVRGYDPDDVYRMVRDTKAELLASLKGDELAGTRAAIEKLDPLSGTLQLMATANARPLVTTESANKAFNTFAAQLSYLKPGKRSVELKIMSTPGKANFYFYATSEQESRLTKTERKPLAVVCTDECPTTRFRGSYYYVIRKGGYKSKEFPLDLWDVKGAKFKLQCPLYEEATKDDPVACSIVEDKQ